MKKQPFSLTEAEKEHLIRVMYAYESDWRGTLTWGEVKKAHNSLLVKIKKYFKE